MVLVWCFLKTDYLIFAIKPFVFSVLAATENESVESFDTNAKLNPRVLIQSMNERELKFNEIEQP